MHTLVSICLVPHVNFFDAGAAPGYFHGGGGQHDPQSWSTSERGHFVGNVVLTKGEHENEKWPFLRRCYTLIYYLTHL